MWDKETSKTKKPEETSVEGNTKNSASRYFKRNNLYENVSAGTDTVVVATYVVNDDDDCADNRRNITDRPRSLGTEQNDIDHLLSIVQLSDGPSTSSSSQKNELTNKVPYSAKLSDLKSVASMSTAAKEIPNTEELTVAIDNDELPYKNKNIKSQSSMQSNKSVNSVKYSPISRKPTQNEKVPEQRSRHIPSDNVAGPQIQSLYDKSLNLSAEDLHSTTRAYSSASVEDLTSMSDNRACSPSPSSITSASTLRFARSTSGRRMECLRHMRRPPKEPEEYLDALFPHIRKAHNQIRTALLHAPLTDVKDNALLKKKMLELIQVYTSGCKDEFERVGPSLVLCRRLKRNIIRVLDLFHEICSSSREDHAYLYHISQLIAVYTSLEIRLSFNLARLQKCALIHRISHIIHKHLMVKNESVAKENILRMFLRMPDTYSARFIMEPLFNTFLQEIPTSSHTWCQKELPDKVFVQYIIILHMWKEMLRDPLEQVELINRAQHFMCPTKTLHANPMYANHLPTIHTRKHAVKDILNSLKFFHDLRNAAICDDTLHDGDDDIEVVIDEVINTPFWDFGATYTGDSKQPRHLNRRVITADPTECVDLTHDDEQQSRIDTPLEWLTKLKERAAERVQVDESEKVICLDSDSDGELFCGSILDPSESYQDCDAVDTDYTSLDGSTTDDKDLSEDEVLSGNGITPNGLRTYLAPRTKNQINVTNEKRATTCPPLVTDPYERTRDCDGEGDSAAVGTKNSAVATTVTTAEPTLPLIVNSFTVRGKQNMHLLNSPRFSLDIGPERLGSEDIEFHDTCVDERELTVNFKTTKNQNHFKRADSAVSNDHTARLAPSVGGYYEKEVNNYVTEEEDEYNSLPSTASSSTTALGKVIYTQALLRPSPDFLTEYDEREDDYNRTDCTEKTVVDDERNKEDNKKQMFMLGEDKPVKKQVKFNDNPIGPTRRPHTKLPIKPAIHLSKIQPNTQQPIFSNSPQPRFLSPSSSTSSTTESLKQMAQKGRNFVDIIKRHKSKKLLKSSSTIIIDSDDDDDDIVYVNNSANKNMNLVSTQPIQSKNTCKKGITNEQMNSPICKSNNCNNKNRMCKMQACDVSNSTTMILGPKDISSTNNMRKQSVDINRISDNEERVNIVSIVSDNVGVLEVVKQIEREEQNSNVSTTTGPNVDSNIADESSIDLESACEQEGYRAHSLEVMNGSDVCTSTSTDAFLQSTECRASNLAQSCSNTESVKVVEGVQLLVNAIGSKNLNTSAAIADKLNQRMDVEKILNKTIPQGNDMNNGSVSINITCEDKGGLDDKCNHGVQTTVLQQCLDSQCTNKVADESTQGTEDAKCQELNEETTILTEKMQSETVCVLSKETSDYGNDNVLKNNADGAVKNLSSSEKINDEKNCTNSVTTESFSEINETCSNQSIQKELKETSVGIEASLDKVLHGAQSCSQVASDELEVQITVNTENNVQTTEIPKNIVEKLDTSNTVTTEECLTEKQQLEQPTLHEASDNTLDAKVIITDNTVTLSQQSENGMVEKIVTSLEELNVEESAIHAPTENEIIETHNTTKVAHETDMEHDNSVAVSELNADAINLNIEKSSSQETTAAVNLSENNTQSSGDVKSPVVEVQTSDLNEYQITTTKAEEKINFNIDLENLSNEKCISKQIEMRKDLETAPNNYVAKISMVQTELIEVPTEKFNPTIAKSDGLVRLVEAVKAVEALTFTKQITEYIVPAERARNEQEKHGEDETTFKNEKNVLTLAPILNLSTAILKTPKANDNGKAMNTLENSLEKSDTCTLIKPKAIVSNNSYFSGDKSPKTNLERLAEAAVQKYGEHVADRETCSVAHIKAKFHKLVVEPLAAENVDKNSCEMPKLQTDIIGDAIGSDSANIDHDINKIAERETKTIALNIAKLQADQRQIACQEQLKSTAIVIDNIQISQPIDYDMHIFNLCEENVKSMPNSCKFNATMSRDCKEVDISTSAAPIQEYGNFDNISEIEKNNSSTVSTFHSHFESFISTLKTNEGSKSEVKGQRRSPRTQKLYATTTETSSPTSENVKSAESYKKVSAPRHIAVKNLLSKSNEDLVITNVHCNKSLAQSSPSRSASSDSEVSNIGGGAAELRKGYSLRKSEQWKVVKNTSLRASPPGNQAECMDTRKSVNPTLTTKRCIKIRLARAKVPTMAERKEHPTSSEQTEAHLDTQFGDVSHRPITRRLAAALNSSLQMVTENAVIEPIKPFARGKKSKSKLAENTQLKRRKCENLISTQRQNERANKAATAKETVLHNEAISTNVKEKRKHCALESTQKSHSEPLDAVTILQNSHFGNIDTISDDSTCLPEEVVAKRMKIRKRKNVMKNDVTETVTTIQNADFTFETVFVKSTKAIKNSKPKDLSTTKAITLQQKSMEESETLITINKKERTHVEDVPDYKPTVEATMQEKKTESDEIAVKSKTNVLSTTCTSQNSIENNSIQLTEKPALANNSELSGEPNVRIAIEDPTERNEQGSDVIADNSINSDSIITLDKITVCAEKGLSVLEENSNEKSGKVSDQKLAVISQYKEVRAETDEPINKSCAETSFYIIESVLRTPKLITPSDKSSSTGESEDASDVLDLVKNKTIDAEETKVEITEETGVSVSVEETTNKVDTKTEVLIRESVSSTLEHVKHLTESSSIFDANETSALVLDENMKSDFVKTNDSAKTLTTETGVSVLEEDVNKRCAEKMVVIGETVLNTQVGVTTLDESSSTDHAGDINVLDVNESDLGDALKTARNAETTAQILTETINKDDTETDDFIADSVYKTQESVTHHDEIHSTNDSKETTALFLDEEIDKQFMKTSDSEKTLTTETSVSDLEKDINNSCIVETHNELVPHTTQSPTKQILLTNELESAPITYREDADTLPESNEAPRLIDISNFTSLTLDTKTVRNFRDVSEFLDEDSNINLRISHLQIADKSEYLNESESINTLKTNMEVDKLLEEYNHSARMIASANLKIPMAMQTPTDGRTPACSSVTFSFTGSDSSSSFTNSCSCSTTSTVNSATDLYKNEPTSFKVVQSQAQVVELLSSTNTSFQDLSLLDLEHDVIMSNDDLLSELIPTTMMDTMTATSLEHNYAIKPFETAIRNEYDTQNEDNGNTEELLNTNNNETPLQAPSLKVSIPIAFIKRFEVLTDNRPKNWYLTEKPTTSKAALAALAARRNAQFKTDIVHIFNSNRVSRHKQSAESTFTESLENKQDIATTDSAVTHQLLASDSCSPLPSLPLKKRRNISGVLEEDFCNASVMLSDDSDLVTMISQESSSNESKKLSDVTTEMDENKQIEFSITSDEVETAIVQQTAAEKQADCQYETNDEIVTESKQDSRENIISDIENTGASDEDVARDQDLVEDQQKEVILHLATEEIQMSEHAVTDQQSLAINDITPITQNITDESAVQEEPKDRTINNITPIAQEFTDKTALLGDQQNMVTDETETDGTVTNIEFQEGLEQSDTEAVTNENQIEKLPEKLNDIEVTAVQHTFVPEQQDFALNEDCHTEDSKDVTATGLLDDSKSIAVFKEIQELMTIQQIHCKDNTLENFNDRANEVILSSYEDQFLVTVCLNDTDTVSGFEATNNYFASKEYEENDFDIGKDVIINTQEIKEESTEFISNLNSPKNSPINLTKPLSTNAVDLNTPMLKQNEFLDFTSDSPNSLAPTNSTNFQLFTTTMPNNEIVSTDLNVNNISQFTNCELNIDQVEPSERKNLVDLSQMDELSFGEHETLQTTQLPRAIEQMDQLEYNNFAQSQIHNAITDTCTTDTFVGMASPLKITTNAEQTENVREMHSTLTPTIKICSTNKSKPMEDDEIIAMPTILAQSEHLAKPLTLSPVLPLIKPTTTTINTIYEKSNTIFSFPDIETETTLTQNFVPSNNFATTTTASLADNCTTTTLRTAVDKSPTTFPSQSSTMSQLQTPSTPRSSTQSTIRARAPARVQIVTPQRKNREIAPKTSEEEAKTPNIIFTNTTTSLCSSLEFDMHEVAATIPVAYPTTPPRYANLFQFEKYIQKLMTLIDVPGIIDSARNLFVDKQALAEAHAALLAQATQFDDEGNAISEPLLLKYHKDGTISILNDNDECIILTANMSKMVKSLSLALSILQEQQSPVLGMRARIHALLKQLTQTNTTTKTAHVAPNIINSTVIPTAVVNPTNLVDNSRDLDMTASNAMAYGSGIGGEIRQQVPPSLEVLNTNLQNLQLYAANWQNIEDNGLITSIPNTDIDTLPFAADDAATNYEHAVSFNFDEPAAILPSNENTNATRFENAFHATLDRTVEENCTKAGQNRLVHWQHERPPANKVSASATHTPPSCTDVVYEQNVNGTHENVATGCMDVNNDNLHVVMIDHRDDTLIDSYAMAGNKAHAIAEVGGKRLATVSPKGEKSKKTVYPTSDNNQHARTQSTHRKSTAQGSPKKLATKRVEKVPKAHCTLLQASVAVTPQQHHTRNTAISKARSMSQSDTSVPRTTHTIHYRHMPQPTVTANMAYKPSATLHYKQPIPRQQQQLQRISSLQMPTHYVASNANQLPPAIPHISLENGSNLPLFAQQYAQNSALSGGVGLLHNNNIRYLLATPHTRARFTPASTTLANSSNSTLNVTAEAQETLAQYPQYQLQALHTQPNFADNLKINELQLQSLIKNATHGETVDDRGSTAVADAAAAAAAPATTTNVLRSFRSAVRIANAPKTDRTPSLIFNNDTQTTAEGMLLTTQRQQQHQQHAQQQQQIQCVQPTSALIISSIQQKQEAELESLRQELAKRDTQLQTDLQLPLAQHESRSQSKVERNQRMYTTITPISPGQAKHQPRPHTLSTIVNTPHALGAPISLSTQANASRKRGRPRKYNLGDDMLLVASDLLQKQSVGESAQKYAKLHESPCKIRANASARHKLPMHKQNAHSRIRQILPTTQHMPNIKSHEATSLQPSTLSKATSRCTPSELRPSFTSSANAFHLIENMVEAISPQNQVKSTAICQQQQPQQESHLLHQQLPQTLTAPTHSQLVDQGNHINAIATLFSGYKITKPPLASGAAARNGGNSNNTTLVNKSKYKAGPKSMHMSRKTTAMSGTRKNSTNSPQSSRSIPNSQSPTKRNHSTSPVSLRANSPVIISPETAADPKLNMKCAVIMKENEEVINYKRQQVAFINELLEKQREMQRQRALKRQEFQNILKQKREEGKRLMAEISQIKKQQAEAHEKVLETQLLQPKQSPTILNRKRLLVKERNVTFKTNSKVRSRSTTPNRTNNVDNHAERAEKEVYTTSAAIMQSVIGDTFELAAEAMPLSEGVNRSTAALKNMKATQEQDQKSATSIRSTAGMANEEAANTLINSPKTKVQCTSSKTSTVENVNSSLKLCKASSDDTPNKAIKTNISAIETQPNKTVQKAEELIGTEMQGKVVPTTSKTSFSENPKIPALQALATSAAYTRCARSMTPTRGVYDTTKQSEVQTERTTDNLLINCSLSSPTSSQTRLQRAPSLSPSIFMNRNRVEVRRSMQDPTSNTDFTVNNASWLLPESPRTLTKTLKVRLKRLQHLNMSATTPSLPEKEISDKISMPPSVMPTFSRECAANVAPTVAIAVTETSKISTLEFHIKSNKHKRVQLLKHKLKKELLELETYVRPVDTNTKDEIARLQLSNDVACSQATQTAEGRISKVSRRKPQRRPQQSSKKLRLLEKVILERHTNKMQADLRIKDNSTCDNAGSKNVKTANIDIEDGLQCDRNEDTKEIVRDILTNGNNDVGHCRQLPIEPSENVVRKAFAPHGENTAKQKQFSSEPTRSDKHAIEDVRIGNTRKEPTTNNAMDINCSNASDKKHKRTHKHGAIVTQVVDVTPGRHVNDSLLGDLLLTAASNNSAALNDVLNTTPKLDVIEPTASELEIPGNVNEPCATPTVDAPTFAKPNNLLAEGANDKTHIEITNEMAVAVSGLAMLANRPITTTTTTNTENCINAHGCQNENVDIIKPKQASSELFSSAMQPSVAEPTTVIGLLNDTQTHTITSIDEHATIVAAKPRVIDPNPNELITLPNDTGCMSEGEESSSDCLLSQLSKRVHKMTDLERIVDATTVHVIKDATMALMSFEATPTLPAYLLNGESRDVPTPPAIATPAPTPTADLTPEAEQPKPPPTPPPPLSELMVKESPHTPMPILPIIREPLIKANDSRAATVSVQVSEPAQENMISLPDAPQQAEQEQIIIEQGLCNNHLSSPLVQDQQLEEEVNSPAPASAISTSDHEVSSTQEIIYTPTKRSNANTLNNSSGISIPPTPIDEEAAMLVQNSQIDTTHHLPESSYYMRKRARKFSDEFTMCENKNENSTKDIMKQRRKTFSSESCLPIQISTNNTTFTKKTNNELTNSSATASTSNGINNGSQNSGGSSPSTTTEPVSKQVQPRRRNHTQKRNNSQSPLTGRSRPGGSVGELNGNFVYSCSRLQPTTVDMADMERCVVLPASAVVPPVNLGNFARTYSKNNLAQIKVFVPPEVEMCLENEDAEKDVIVATTTSKRGRPKNSVPKESRKQPKLESAAKVKSKKTATNITKTKAVVQLSNKRDKADSHPQLEDGKSSKSPASTKAPTRTKNVERAPNRKRK